ncbi:MAG: QueT transporter family protein [Deltaproteobacteria bacterium]|uniref:QueT transporter family protein n=1 Tax=Candidatus Zymogenus saltonus TaxID=2844893 RepID=A0A9D8KE25_9DELT|nr:QueT transporter family protein [Candidatus Zymogenus saltonus]
MSENRVENANPTGGPRRSIHPITEIAVISALYVALTVYVYPISYGPIQFRISEAVVILVATSPYLIVFVPIGCFIANLLSPYAGFWDLIFMPLVSTVGAIPMAVFGRRYLLFTSWFYAVVTAAGVGLMLSVILEKGYIVLTVPVLVSQMIIMTIAFFMLKGYSRYQKHREGGAVK